MKLRLAWLADHEYADTYSARESRVLLRALARNRDVIPLWFAVGSEQPPHFWNGIRVFPLPTECLGLADFLQTLLAQQRPQVVLSNLPHSAFPAGFRFLARNGATWLHRLNRADIQSVAAFEAATLLVGKAEAESAPEGAVFIPYLKGLDQFHSDGDEPTAILQRLEKTIADKAFAGCHSSMTHPCHLVLRHQLFSNASVAHVMFELTNALIELGVPTIPQDEQAMLSRGYVRREADLLQSGVPDKYQRILESLHREYDPENAIVVHFAMLRAGAKYTRYGVFSSLTPREIFYTTGNHTVTPHGLRRLASVFEMILAPSEHVLRPYLEAGLHRSRGAVIPHGIDPLIFSPQAPPLVYATEKRFKFLQTSFPWIYEKGFGITIKAFGRAFSNRDDVALILRIPRIQDPTGRSTTIGRLEGMVKEAATQPGAPQIILVEHDVSPDRRGGIYTGTNCYLFPLRAEGFGMTILEAMACGLPVIATPWSGPADFLSPRYAYTLRHSNPFPERAKNGSHLRYHVEPDVDHLIYLMRHAYEHQEEAQALGRSASEVARGRWTWQSAGAKLASTLSVAPASVQSAAA